MSREEIDNALSKSDIAVVTELASFVIKNCGGSREIFNQKLHWLRLDYSRLGATHEERNKHRSERRRAMRAVFQEVKLQDNLRITARRTERRAITN